MRLHGCESPFVTMDTRILSCSPALRIWLYNRGTMKTFSLSLVLILSVAVPIGVAQRTPDGADFSPEEATIASIHTAFAARRVTCVQLIQSYLKRIEMYDDHGPA